MKRILSILTLCMLVAFSASAQQPGGVTADLTIKRTVDGKETVEEKSIQLESEAQLNEKLEEMGLNKPDIEVEAVFRGKVEEKRTEIMMSEEEYQLIQDLIKERGATTSDEIRKIIREVLEKGIEADHDADKKMDELPEFLQKAKMMQQTEVEWSEILHNFGTLTTGDKAKHTYKVKNVGKHNLFITHVKPSCGCTAPNWTQYSIKPGETGEIEIEYDSKKVTGTMFKNLTVYGNFGGKQVKTLKFQAEVVPPAEEKK